MMGDIEVLDSDHYEVVTVNGDVIVLQKNADMFSDAAQESEIGGDELQILTLHGPDDERWTLDASEDTIMKPPEQIVFGPPAIEEENSSDNLPAIGHLEEFSIPTAEDGTLLPATVNAKMADGSHQRLTLFPQIIDGNVTYMVQFENDEITDEGPPAIGPEEPTLLQKIDSIISQNEDIIANSKRIRAPRKEPLSNGISRPHRFRQKSLMRNKSLLKVNVPQTASNAFHFPKESVLTQGPSLPYLKIKEDTKFPDIPTSNTTSEFPSELQHAKNFLSLQKYLESQKLQLKIQPIEAKDMGRPIKPKIPQQQDLLNLPKPEVPLIPPVPSPPPPTEEVADSDRIFIKTSPEYFTNKEKNEHPLGSTENPIQLLQTGKTFHSRQPLSETQLQQISSILRKQKFVSSEIPKSMYDPNTNTRIVYRVVFPEDVDVDKNEEAKAVPAIKRPVKRNKQKTKSLTVDGEAAATNDQQKNNNGDSSAAISEPLEPAKPPPPKVAKLARTRSGRLSRPPRHMVRDYKRIQNVADVSNRANEEEWYLDYRTPEVEPTTNTSLFSNGLRPRAKLKQRNVKPEYRCPTCHKIYLGHARMMWHLRKFPDHSNADEYEEIYQRARCERKARRINLFKLKQMLTGVDRVTLQATYGPFLADAFTLWDFLLLRVRLLKKTGVQEVEGLLKELTLLLDKLGKMAEELLSPVYSRDEEDAQYIELDKHEVAYALGLPLGTYKVNSERLNLLQLAEEEQRQPPPPLPRPTQLATKFEPNLSTKLLDCSNDSIDLDCSSKDVEPEEEKKDVDDTNSEFLSEFLQSLPEQATDNHIPSSSDDGLSLWKSRNDVAHVTPPPMWNKGSSPHHIPPPVTHEELSLWKGGKSVHASEDLEMWKQNEANSWKNGDTHGHGATSNMWKESSSQEAEVSAWKSSSGDAGRESIWEGSRPEVLQSPSSRIARKEEPNSNSTLAQNGVSSEADMWLKENSGKPDEWADSAGEKDGKKDWMRLWKEEVGAPGLRTGRLTSTPESHGPTLFSPPLRRNSVSSFAPTHQEELLSLDLHELFEDLMPEQSKPRRPKPNSIESIINEALFTGNEPPPTHSSLPPSLNIISDALDEVTNLDFLHQD